MLVSHNGQHTHHCTDLTPKLIMFTSQQFNRTEFRSCYNVLDGHQTCGISRIDGKSSTWCEDVFWLVVLTILKHMSSSMGRMTTHIWMENNPAMFETTKQFWWFQHLSISSSQKWQTPQDSPPHHLWQISSTKGQGQSAQGQVTFGGWDRGLLSWGMMPMILTNKIALYMFISDSSVYIIYYV